MTETQLVQSIKKYLATLPECFFWKEHGGQYGTAGMRYCEHMPWAEISSSLRISLPYVYKLHDRALAEIEKKMHRV